FSFIAQSGKTKTLLSYYPAVNCVNGIDSSGVAGTFLDYNSAGTCLSNIILNPQCNITPSTSSTPVACFGGNTGSASISLTGATPPVSYTLNGNPIPGTGTSNSVSGLSA